ncbi:SDR family NAD(P)-dependent oxidoreductase [Amycolatopsis nigrescens]|uniref:SDR family NAD(P)-dependent oxidoreductase n=1 Tax=Amycolatopsis nigrescens TaxID=381445 RepID=UPI00037DE533|nr:SDR family oxidoreductase [Amycolatopsis nigrescens]
MSQLEGRVALVTGSSRGIGRAVALKLSSAGARVVVNGTDTAAVKETIASVEAGGGVAVSCVGDITQDGFPQRFVDTAVEAFGGVDIVVNNAGFAWDSVIQKMSDQQWHRVLDVHLGAPFRILRAAQPVISAAAKGEIRDHGIARCRKVVNVSALAGVTGNAGQINYAAAKAGLAGLTRTLCKEWGRYNVTVNTVAFGLVVTRASRPMDHADNKVPTMDAAGKPLPTGVNPELLATLRANIPLGRMGTVEEAAGAVYLFCSPESDYISGETVNCGGGLLI